MNAASSTGRTLLIVFGSIIGLAVVAVLAVLLWHGSWALYGANLNQEYKSNTGSQQYQAGLISQERDNSRGFDVATDPGQKSQIKATFCQIYLDLKPAPNDLVQANARICN